MDWRYHVSTHSMAPSPSYIDKLKELASSLTGSKRIGQCI